MSDMERKQLVTRFNEFAEDLPKWAQLAPVRAMFWMAFVAGFQAGKTKGAK